MGLSSKVYSKVLAVTFWKVHFSHINFFSGKPLLIVHVVVNKAASWKAKGKKSIWQKANMEGIQITE